VTPLDWNQSLGCRSIEKKQIRLQENLKMVSNITDCKGKKERSGEFRKRVSVFLKWARESKSAFMFQRFVFFFLSLGSANQGVWHLDGGNAWTVVIWRPWCWEHVLFWEWEGLWWCNGNEEGAFARLHILAGEDVDNWVLSDGQFDLSRYFFFIFNFN